MVGLLLEAVIVALIGGTLYTIVGIIPGTDETATMAPPTLVLVMLGFDPAVIVAWFFAISCGIHTGHIIPTCMVGLPGSVMATPMVDDCLTLKRLGVPHVNIRKMASGAVIGMLISIPLSCLFALALAPVAQLITPYVGYIFLVVAILMSLTTKSKISNIIIVFLFGVMVQCIQLASTATIGKTLSVPMFMGITIGPMVYSMMCVLHPKLREKRRHVGYSEIYLAPEATKKVGLFANPFKFLTKGQLRRLSIASAISSFTFTLSPTATEILMGQTLGNGGHGTYDRKETASVVRAGTCNGTFIAEIMIPLVAFGLPVSPATVGPGQYLFNAPPVFTTEPMNNIHTILSVPEIFLFALLGAVCAIIIAYPCCMRFARVLTKVCLKAIGQEAMIGMFLGLIVMLSFHEAGIFGVVVCIVMAFVGGLLNKEFEFNSGIQFMAFYAAATIFTVFFGVA